MKTPLVVLFACCAGTGCGEVTAGGSENAPTIESFDPAAGTSAGGTTVTITGTNFESGGDDTSVVIGSLTAIDVTVVDDTTLTFTTPVGPPGEDVDVTVFNENGFGDAPEQFLYNDLPIVRQVSPQVGPATGGTTITITGVGFDAIDSGTTTVMVGGAAATDVTVVSDTEITAQTGALADTAFAALDVSVVNNNGTDSLSKKYRYTQPGLLGTTRRGGNGQGVTTLFYLNPATLEVAEVAELPVKMSNFAFDTNGQLFAMSPQNTTLFRIDTNDFSTEAIGAVIDTATMGQRRVSDLAFIGTTLFGFDRNDRRLFSVDLSTGAGTTLGATQLPQGTGVCLRVRDGGSFFMLRLLDGNVEFLNAADSVATTGPLMNGPANVRCHGLAEFNGDVFLSTARDVGGSDSGRLFTIDLATGILTEVGDLPFNFTSLFPTPDTF